MTTFFSRRLHFLAIAAVGVACSDGGASDGEGQGLPDPSDSGANAAASTGNGQPAPGNAMTSPSPGALMPTNGGTGPTAPGEPANGTGGGTDPGATPTTGSGPTVSGQGGGPVVGGGGAEVTGNGGVPTNGGVPNLAMGGNVSNGGSPLGNAGAGIEGQGGAGVSDSVTIEESSTGFCGLQGVIESDNAGFTGSGYANSDAGAGQGIEWSVDASGGAATLTFRYASIDARRAVVLLDDVEVGTLPFAATGTWTTWAEESLSVDLAAGENRIRLEATSELGLANIDNLTIAGVASVPLECELPVPPLPEFGEPIGFATENGGTTGGAAGQVVTVSNYADLKSYAESSAAYVIMIEGTISNGAGGGQIRVASNKSLIGVGSAAFLSGVGITISSSNNIIIQNLRASLVGTTTPSSVNGGDIMTISGTSKNIWVDHCEFFSEDPSVQTDIDKYDGLIDIRDQTGFITLSWNYMHDHHKGSLVGSADTDLYVDRKVTFHHNHYDNVKYRVPMCRGSVGHFFNNYIVGAEDATEIREGTCVRVEKNYYEALHYSIYTPSDHPGSTERIDNIEVSRTSRAYPANCTADIPYEYESALTTTTQDVKTIVPQGAGVGKL